jgi:uncharacterized protein YacL (UPF0231 family)
MEYEFQRNTSTGELLAEFSMGQEVIGFWLIEELGKSSDKYEALCQVISKLQRNQLKEWRIAGKALSIELDRDEVRIFSNELDSVEVVELEDAMSLYDGESEAFCGLEDFNGVLNSWHDFINNGY